nr:protein indeterminate-domain 7 [Ipomoea batatas]
MFSLISTGLVLLDPEAEVVALSPNTLFATNRFVCEICNKGFQRDQNLQLHRRGHNLPWKLKQRNKEEVVKKKVYVCPEASCVHHDPARALGDLTGIKKHYSRKHGEKKWKCDKCSKRYAVQSDWKAHSKICGTREYRCDCGTLFSRRDSFITHRAFCDALAEESASSREELASSYGTNKPAAGHASLTPGCMEMMGGTTGSDTTGFYYHHQGFNGGRENTDIEGLNTRDFLSLTASFSSSKGFSQNSACWPP